MYLCKWLIGPQSYRLQPQSHHHATYPNESTCESGLSVHTVTDCSQSHHHATYPNKSTCGSGLLVHNSHRLKAQSCFHATYLSGSTCENGFSVHDSHRPQPHNHHLQLILVEVLVKVACRSTTATDWRHRAISMLLILGEVSVNVACRSTTVTY